MKQVLALDADQVLLDCDGSFRDVGSVVLNRNLVPLNNAYNLDLRYGITNEEVMMIFDSMMHHELGWRGMRLLEGVKEAYMRLEEHFTIHIVTAIPESIRLLREESLAVHGIFPHAIHCAGHHLASKTAILEAIRPVMFVDDRLKHLKEASFVPHRVWVDHQHDQDGLSPDEDLYHVNSLLQWVQQWQTDRPSVRSALKY